MPITFSTTDKEGMSNGAKVLVYGPSGAGKTVLCATAPTPMIASCESGLMSLRKVRHSVALLKNAEDLADFYRWSTQSAESRLYQSLCLDSLTEIAEVLLAYLMKTVGQKDPRKAFGELVPQMSSLIRLFRDIPGKNVYMSAKMEQVKDEGTGAMMFGPSMPGQKMGPSLPYFFDEVFYIGVANDPQTKQPYRYLQTQPDLQRVAKDRSGSLSAIEYPDLTQVFTKILS